MIKRTVSKIFQDEKSILLFTFILGIVLTIVITKYICGYNSDASCTSLPMIHAFSIGDWDRAFLLNWPPLYPAIAGCLAYIGVPTFTAAVIVSSTFSVLSIFPLYGLLKYFTSKKYAAVGSLLYLIVPKMIVIWVFTHA